jgi:hypothetical protein
MAFESTATAEYLYDNSQHNEDDNMLLIEKISSEDNEYDIEDKTCAENGS